MVHVAVLPYHRRRARLLSGRSSTSEPLSSVCATILPNGAPICNSLPSRANEQPGLHNLIAQPHCSHLVLWAPRAAGRVDDGID
jgi:hypothetical protein